MNLWSYLIAVSKKVAVRGWYLSMTNIDNKRELFPSIEPTDSFHLKVSLDMRSILNDVETLVVCPLYFYMVAPEVGVKPTIVATSIQISIILF